MRHVATKTGGDVVHEAEAPVETPKTAETSTETPQAPTPAEVPPPTQPEEGKEGKEGEEGKEVADEEDIPVRSDTDEKRLEQLYDEIAWPLAVKYGHTYDAFKLALT